MNWIEYRERKLNDDDKNVELAPIDLDPEECIDDKNPTKPNQDQVDAQADGTRANISSPELVSAMEDVCDGFKRCQLED